MPRPATIPGNCLDPWFNPQGSIGIVCPLSQKWQSICLAPRRESQGQPDPRNPRIHGTIGPADEDGGFHFRTLGPGRKILEQILAASGDYPGTVDDNFTQQTQFALAQWQAQQGQKRYSTEVVARDIRFIGGRPGTGAPGGGGGYGAADDMSAPVGADHGMDEFATGGPDDDIPF